MILWTVKLIGMIRRAIAGRKYPYQLAWAVAFGLLLGIVPHGNLLAICLLVVVLSLRLNHAMAALTAIGASFLATKLDPVSHTVGEYLLTQPKFASVAETAWSLPMMPWTDLNNTVVLGSLTIGLVALLPVFLVTYPVFRFLAPAKAADDQVQESEYETHRSSTSSKTMIVDRGNQRVPPPKRDASREESTSQVSTSQASEPIQFVEVQPAHTAPPQNHAAVETRIDVIRIKEQASTQTAATESDVNEADQSNPNQPMDEALNYLLRQLRDSQSRNAA
ncbi:hypothetical protein LF1_22950 [Rubripirellula obstinata]|uniref:DUF2062 domain-containing protein n=1 Tax=Rubripirellula obstinata TaxID=406547 RepID=A0A5B1CF19_9BACT|nr:TIGR03546 family protein [Rubripirellula obstinata]KAA1259758.1 hypothetical protein LF1_22950 [Rubripirellula obstinata]